MHVPATNWHPHSDKTFEAKAPTEFEAWALAQRQTLMELTHGNLRLMVGYWSDAINVLPPDVRTALLSCIAQGLGLQIAPVEDAPDTIEISMVKRYDPLIGDKTTKSGLVVPQGAEAPDLILPGDKRYNQGR
jgi:hypothetical protein